MIYKSNSPITYISDSDAIIDVEYAYNKITTLHLGEDEGQIEHLSDDIKEEFSDQVVNVDNMQFHPHSTNNKPVTSHSFPFQSPILNVI